uniref:Uncharacterized protein n=1 Tax=Strigamia maritima TaxID=126957 RepID=T1JIE7_STRMM
MVINNEDCYITPIFWFNTLFFYPAIFIISIAIKICILALAPVVFMLVILLIFLFKFLVIVLIFCSFPFLFLIFVISGDEEKQEPCWKLYYDVIKLFGF